MSQMTLPVALERIDEASIGKDAAIVFIHGFTGSGAEQGTWKDLATQVMMEDRLRGWDGWAMTYGTGNRPWSRTLTEFGVPMPAWKFSRRGLQPI